MVTKWYYGIIWLLIVVVFMSVVTAGCVQITPQNRTTPTITEAPGYMVITPQEAKDLIDRTPGLIIIDTSTPQNFAKGHLPNAANYCIGDDSLNKTIPSLDKNTTYLVYSRAERASILGAKKLIDSGFPNVYRLKGEYQEWNYAGYPVEI